MRTQITTEGRPTDKALLQAYRNAISFRAHVTPRLDDINARFLVEELQEKIADAVKVFDEKVEQL